MPKETTYGEQHAFAPVVGGPEAEPLPKVPIVEVLWAREGGYVQIVTKATDPHGGRWAEDEDPETHFTDGMYVDLTRYAINKLIRDLRRARDQALGRDE